MIRFGGRDWDVRIGNGHAPEHATFWSRDCDLVIGGDQLLATISPNLGVYATEPEADPVGDWLDSCERPRALRPRQPPGAARPQAALHRAADPDAPADRQPPRRARPAAAIPRRTAYRRRIAFPRSTGAGSAPANTGLRWSRRWGTSITCYHAGQVTRRAAQRRRLAVASKGGVTQWRNADTTHPPARVARCDEDAPPTAEQKPLPQAITDTPLRGQKPGGMGL